MYPLDEATELTKTTGRSIAWQVAGGGWQTFIRLGASVFLARALTPTDFGLFGMALLVKEMIAACGNLGMGTGLIAQKEVSQVDLSTAFWSMVVVRIAMFLLLYSSAPLMVYWLDDPRIVDVVRVISFVFLIMILQESSLTLLIKEMRYRVISIVGAIAIVIQSALAICLAMFTDLGYWSLVFAMIAYVAFTSVAIFVAARWRPRFEFSRQSFRYLFRYGYNGMGFAIVNYLSQNLDYLLVSRILGAGALGLYEFAYRIPHLIQVNISQPVGSVLLPALSKVQDSDERLLAGYLKAIKFVALLAFPALAGLAALADVAVHVLWGDQWASIVVPLQILCVSAALRVIPQPCGAILYCKNRPDVPFKLSLIGLAWTVLSVGGLGYYFGLVGVASGMVLSVFASLLAIVISFRLINAPLKRIPLALWPIIASTALCSITAFAAKIFFIWSGLPQPLVLLLAISVGAMVYPLSLYKLFPSLAAESAILFEDVAGKTIPSVIRRHVLPA